MIDIVNIGPNGARVFELEFKKHPESLMRLHHPECGHCKAMEPEWKDLKKELKNNYSNYSNYNNNVGVFDIHADALSNINESALQGINGFPTILVIKGGKSIHYNGDRSKDDMLKFSLEHLNIEKNKKKLISGRKNKKQKTKKLKTKKQKTKKSNTKKQKIKKRNTQK